MKYSTLAITLTHHDESEKMLMIDKPDIVQIKMDKALNPPSLTTTKAFQVKIDDNKTIIVYNRIQNYILDSLIKAVFK